MKYRILGAAALFCSIALGAQNRTAQTELPPRPMPSQALFVKYDATKVCNLADWTPSDMEVSGSSQGFAIYGDYAVQLHDKGQFVLVNLKTRKVVSSFFVDGNESHCNNCNFSSRRSYPEAEFPLLYVSECKGDHACYVIDMDQERGKIFQTIHYDDADCKGGLDWALDEETGSIWAYWGDGPHTLRTMARFRLPSEGEGEADGSVHLRRTDVLEQFDLPTIDIAQGLRIKGGKAYLTDGAPKTGRMGLHIYDLRTHAEEAYLDLSPLGMEPEGLDVKDGQIWVAFHVKGKPRNTNIYKITIRK